MGDWKEVEGSVSLIDSTDRMEPIEGALPGRCGCVNVAVDLTAVTNEIDSLEPHVSVDFDPRIVFMIHDVDRSNTRFDDLDISIEVIDANLTDDDIEVTEYGGN